MLQLVQEHKEIMPDLNCAQVQDATVKIQSAYRGFKTRKEMKEGGNDLPDLKAANVAAATLRIQAYYRGFKARKAMREQEGRQAQARANVEEAALRVRLPGSSRKKVISHQAPKTP